MSGIKFLSQELLLNWLESLGVEHYLCGQCDGIHISDLQGRMGVVESRLFLEQDCLAFSTELDILNSKVLAVSAEISKMNSLFPNLKFFLQLYDDGPARVIICDSQWVAAGLSKEQFSVFLQRAVDAKLEALQDFIDCRFVQDGEVQDNYGEIPSLH